MYADCVDRSKHVSNYWRSSDPCLRIEVCNPLFSITCYGSSSLSYDAWVHVGSVIYERHLWLSLGLILQIELSLFGVHLRFSTRPAG